MKFKIFFSLRKRVIRRFKKRPKKNKAEYEKHKAQALSLAHERIAYFNTFYNFTINKITIRNQKSRWGSCSRQGNINFNYKIALLPPELADYIVVHEICHLGEFNHSKNFWDLVARTMPEYKEMRMRLKKHGNVW